MQASSKHHPGLGDQVSQLDLSLFIWTCYLILLPFYVFRSGNPQPADILILLAIALQLGDFPRLLQQYAYLGLAVLLLGYIVTVNGVWTILTEDGSFLKSILFYAFNTLLIMLSFRLAEHPRFWRATYYALMVTLFLQAILFLGLGGSGEFRETLFFNNPNQLGYWSLLMTALLLYLFRHQKTPVLIELLAIVLLMGFTLLSLSKAAIVSNLLLILYHIWSSWHIKLPILLALTVGIMLLSTQDFSGGDIQADRMARIYWRFASIQEENDTFNGRGYDRLSSHPYYLLLGAGEGGYRRFDPLYGKEIHSSLGTLLFCYGLPGLLLFVGMAILAFLKGSNFVKIAVFCLMAYSLTHMGLRFSLFWVALSLMYLGSTRKYTISS